MAKYSELAQEDGLPALDRTNNSDNSRVNSNGWDRCCEHRCDRAGMSRRQSWLRANAASLVICALLLYIAATSTLELAWIGAPQGSKATEGSEHFTLPQPILQFEDRQEWRLSGPQHPWNLAPSKELDAAWDELLYGLNIRVTPSEVRRLNDTLTNPIRVENGDYLAGLGVFHHLHCLNNIRKALQRDYYAPEIASSSHPEAWEAGHSDHCINAIRESLMCHANTAAYMIEWAEDPHAFLGIQLTSSAVTTCVNWDSLNSWARKRALVKGTFKLQPPLKESTHN